MDEKVNINLNCTNENEAYHGPLAFYQSRISLQNVVHWLFELFHLDQSSFLFVSDYLSSLPVAHLSDAPRRRLVVTGDSTRIQDKTTESSAWFFNVLGV